ncbi:MAG: ABC transporter substrate-binding protein [Oscillospiraceae bacterium]|nr:ABC transporter substrate-binding protein [Oscillospiraceae bacterium]
MKTWKTILALLLVSCMMLTLFAACGKDSSKADETGDSTPSNLESFDPDDPTNITFWMLDIYAHGADHGERITEAVNKILQPEGLKANIVYYTLGDYMSKTVTGIAAGERVDVMSFCLMNSVQNLKSNNMAMDITDELHAYAPELLELMSDYMDAYTYDGRIFGVPTYRTYVSNGYIGFNRDALDEMGLTEEAEKLDSWSGFETLMGKIAEARKGDGTYVFSPGVGTCMLISNSHNNGDKFSDIEVFDTLNDSAGVIYASADGKVNLNQATDAYKQAAIKAKEWFDKGWVYPDGIYDNTVSGELVIQSGMAVSEMFNSEVGVEAKKDLQYQAKSLCVQIYTGQIATSALTMWGIGVPTTAEEPEAACKFMNLLYTNADLMKVLVNGEEGVDYELVDGQAQQIDNMFSQGNFVYGNNLITIPLYGTGADLYQIADATNKAATRSPFLGFALDTADLTNYIANISAVNDQYRTSILSGGYTEASYNEYLSKLETAGVQDYLDAAQAQLDAWMANK